jgi:hypothetical protein
MIFCVCGCVHKTVGIIVLLFDNGSDGKSLLDFVIFEEQENSRLGT